MKHTFTQIAWITNELADPRELHKGAPYALEQLSFSSHEGMKDHGWVKVGTAEITVDLMPIKEMVGSKVETLQKELEITRAAFEKRVMELNNKINSLLALENGVPAQVRDVPVEFDDDIPF